MKKLVAFILLTALTLCGSGAIAELATKAGSQTPDLKLPDLNGKTISLQSYQKEKPVILVFFASWSKSCQTEIKDLQEIYNKKSADLEVLAVSFDKKQNDLRNFISKNGITFPVLLDKKLISLDRFQVLIIPTTLCLNREGVIEKIFVDYDENVKKALAEWLK